METFVNHNVLNICIVMDRFVAAVLEQGLRLLLTVSTCFSLQREGSLHFHGATQWFVYLVITV